MLTGKANSVALHIFEVRNGRISRENVWLEGASVATQLGAAAAA
ncbi:hypothetical protein [Nocardia colli]|nr:hypothetical protein [Nocardia colli]